MRFMGIYETRKTYPKLMSSVIYNLNKNVFRYLFDLCSDYLSKYLLIKILQNLQNQIDIIMLVIEYNRYAR